MHIAEVIRNNKFPTAAAVFCVGALIWNNVDLVHNLREEDRLNDRQAQMVYASPPYVKLEQKIEDVQEDIGGNVGADMTSLAVVALTGAGIWLGGKIRKRRDARNSQEVEAEAPEAPAEAIPTSLWLHHYPDQEA